MKLLTIAIPCYNSQDYMEHCIKTLLVGGEDVEIIIVNDGSKDKTAEIADRYAAKYPGIIKAVHQENAGHGGAVNTGLAHASGLYFKVVDSDDWVNKSAYEKVLNQLRIAAASDTPLDLLITNYVYEKQGAAKKMVMNYGRYLPADRVFHWDEIKPLPPTRYILMHSVIYRTELLRASGLKLPEHTFYVDNIFVFQPLPLVKTIYYLDVNFYRYFIGRSDQSVNEKVMISRIDQQFTVTKLMIGYMKDALQKDLSPKLEKYLYSYLTINMTIASIFAIKSGTTENFEKKQALWAYLKETDKTIYRKVRHSLLGIGMNLPGKIGRKCSVAGYTITQKIYGFN